LRIPLLLYIAQRLYIIALFPIVILPFTVLHLSIVIHGQSKKKPNILNRASVSRRRMLSTVVLCSGDFKLYFHTSHITPLQLFIELRRLEWTCV